MVPKSAIAALIISTILLIFAILSFTVWKNVPHIIYMQSIMTIAAGIPIIILLAKHYEWQITPIIQSPLNILKRKARWNMFDLAKTPSETTDEENLKYNIQLLEQYPFNIHNCSPALVQAYQTGNASIQVEMDQTNKDNYNISRVIALVRPYNVYNVSHEVLESIINDDCHNGVIQNEMCNDPRLYITNLVKATDLKYIQSVYTLIDYVQNYNPLKGYYSDEEIANLDVEFVKELWKLTRDPNHIVYVGSNLSGVTLLKLSKKPELVEQAMLPRNKAAYERISKYAEAYARVHEMLVKSSQLVYPFSNEEYSYPYTLTKSGELPLESTYSMSKSIRGKGPLSNNELAPRGDIEDFNDILYLGKNVHYTPSLIYAANSIRINKYDAVQLSQLPLDPVLSQFLRMHVGSNN